MGKPHCAKRIQENLNSAAKVCPYCNGVPKLVTGAVIYPHRHDLHRKRYYSCEPCGAYVGCHPDSNSPHGRLADKELRQAKKAAHAAFDPLWRGGKMSRSQAYSALAEHMKIPKSHTHIGMFDVDWCRAVVRFANSQL